MVEIIPKPISKFSFGVNALMIVGFSLLLFVILSVFILNDLQKKAVKNLSDLQSAVEVKNNSELKNLERYVLEQRDKINDLTFVLDNHQKSTGFFVWMEKVVHPKVVMESTSLNLREKKVEFTGVAESFRSLGEQLYILKAERNVQSLGLSGMGLSKEGDVSFQLSFGVDGSVLK